MSSKHYKWQTRWQVDLATGVCTHDSGLRVQGTRTREHWSVAALNWPAVERALAAKHGHNTAAMGRRLLGEALRLLNDPRTSQAGQR